MATDRGLQFIRVSTVQPSVVRARRVMRETGGETAWCVYTLLLMLGAGLTTDTLVLDGMPLSAADIAEEIGIKTSAADIERSIAILRRYGLIEIVDVDVPTEVTAIPAVRIPALTPDVEAYTAAIESREADAERKRNERAKAKKNRELPAPNDGTDEQIAEVVDYLNERTGKRFKPSTGETKKLIRGRLADGYTVEDMQRVINSKVSEWQGDPKMRQYLAPSTLFRPANFEKYYQNLEPGSSAQDSALIDRIMAITTREGYAELPDDVKAAIQAAGGLKERDAERFNADFFAAYRGEA